MKRGYNRDDDSNTPERSRTRLSSSLVDSLGPVLSIFHAFLADADAARLLRSSHTAALALLPGYTFASHIFQPSDLSSLRRLRDLGLTYDLRMTQLGLPQKIKEITMDPTSPHLSPIPASVLAMTLCPPMSSFRGGLEERWVAMSAAANDWQHRSPWQMPHHYPALRNNEGSSSPPWHLLHTTDPIGDLDCPLAPGLLPHGLRVLQFNHAYNHTLQVGSLPSSLTWLQFGRQFNQPLAPGVLPPSLLHLAFFYAYTQPLVQGALPHSLERLCLNQLWSHPVEVGILPPRLKALDMGGFNLPLQPNVLPTSLLHLTFGYFDQPLLAGVLPTSLASLRLGNRFTHPLLPGVLPASLRQLIVASTFCHSLEVGSLPEGLLMLHFDPTESNEKLPPLQVGVLPSTLLDLSLSNRHDHPLPAGVIPPGVQLLELSSVYQEGGVQAVLPPGAQLSWFEGED